MRKTAQDDPIGHAVRKLEPLYLVDHYRNCCYIAPTVSTKQHRISCKELDQYTLADTVKDNDPLSKLLLVGRQYLLN